MSCSLIFAGDIAPLQAEPGEMFGDVAPLARRAALAFVNLAQKGERKCQTQ